MGDNGETMVAAKHQLLKAAKDGNVERVNELVKNDPNLLQTALSPNGNTALHIAARFGQNMVVKDIIRLQRNLVVSKNLSGAAPMHLAAIGGYAEVISSLIEGATMDAADSGAKRLRLKEVMGMTDQSGNTPLNHAIAGRHVEAVKILIREYPESTELVNAGKNSAFSIAVASKSSEILKALAEHHEKAPHMLMRSNSFQTLLHGTILRHDLASMLVILETFPQLIKETDEDERSPLHYAAALGYLDMVEPLLARDTSVAYEGDEKNKRPLHLAAEYGQTSVLSRLLDECPDTMELYDGDGRNVLHLAAENGKVDTVKYLMSFPGIEELVNEPDDNSCTPFLLSALNLHSEVVHILAEDPRVNTKIFDRDYVSTLDVVQSIEAEALSMNHGENTRTSEGEGRQEGQNIVDSGDAAKSEQHKHLTLKALEEAKTKRPEYPEDILDRQYPKKEAKTQRSREMARTLIVVTTLIATFTFSAVFNIPGGFKNGGEDEGTAALGNKLAFQLFIIFDTTAMASSITSAITLFWSSWEAHNETFISLLSIAMTLTWIALMALGLAFVTGLYAVLSNVKWLAIVVCVIGCTFPAFVIFFTPLLFTTGLRQKKQGSDILYSALSLSTNSSLGYRMGFVYGYGLTVFYNRILRLLGYCIFPFKKIVELTKQLIGGKPSS